MGRRADKASVVMVGLCLVVAACGAATKQAAPTTTGSSATEPNPNVNVGASETAGSPAGGAAKSQRDKKPRVTSDRPRPAPRRAAATHSHTTTTTRATTTTGSTHRAASRTTTSTRTTARKQHASRTTTSAPYIPTKHRFDLTEVAHVTSRHGGAFVEHGSAAGPPVGSGAIMLRAALTRGGKVVTTFTVDGSGGSFTGQAVTSVHLGSGGVVYDGTAQLTSGTGDYRHLVNSHITVTGSGTLTGHTVLHLTGSAIY